MFKHLLLATDGSPRSLRAAKAAVRYARANGARITAFYATPVYRPDISGDFVPAGFVTLAEFNRRADAKADRYLGQIARLAGAAKVRCATARTCSDAPHAAIIMAAKTHKCDLIFMASHGRRGFAALLIGSETNKVLTHCKLPVLVYR